MALAWQCRGWLLAAVLADYARRNADRLTWTAPSDELLARLRILNGRDADLAADATRAANRLRDAHLAVSPALERAVGDKLSSNPGARDALARWGTPTALRAAGRARIRARIAKRSPRTAGRLTDAICAALGAQSLTVTAEATWGQTISAASTTSNSPRSAGCTGTTPSASTATSATPHGQFEEAYSAQQADHALVGNQ